MPETAAIVPGLKGVEFVTLAGDLYGMPHRQARRRAHEVLNYAGLGELRYRKLEEYSTGNQQRLKLAAALVHDPQLLLLDEPTNGLDPQGRQAMLRLIEDLISETGKSVILCTHLLGDVERLCQQVVVLDRGAVIVGGAMAHVRRTSGHRFELAWQGERSGYLQRLQQAGVQVLPQAEAHQNGKVSVVVPRDWRTATFFELARSANVTLVHLKPEEEDLQSLFFRVTQNGQETGARPAESEPGGGQVASGAATDSPEPPGGSTP
jgi:ABC-2 type transport system ATP-binding protein